MRDYVVRLDRLDAPRTRPTLHDIWATQALVLAGEMTQQEMDAKHPSWREDVEHFYDVDHPAPEGLPGDALTSWRAWQQLSKGLSDVVAGSTGTTANFQQLSRDLGSQPTPTDRPEVRELKQVADLGASLSSTVTQQAEPAQRNLGQMYVLNSSVGELVTVTTNGIASSQESTRAIVWLTRMLVLLTVILVVLTLRLLFPSLLGG